jgi:predicted nucleic acid-binding protein
VSPPFVADASIGLGWVHPNQATELTRRLLADMEAGANAHVPGLWPLEVGNALLVAVRRKLMTEPQRKSALTLLSRLNLVVDTETASLAWSDISDLAEKHSLSIYDACYIELALRKRLPLASRDEPLRAAATKAKLKLV